MRATRFQFLGISRVPWSADRYYSMRPHAAAPLDFGRIWSYEGGLTSYIDVPDLQFSLFGSRLKAREALQRHHSSIGQLSRALGGGWSVKERRGE